MWFAASLEEEKFFPAYRKKENPR